MSTRQRHPDDFRDEVAAHIEHEAERLIEEGMTRDKRGPPHGGALGM